MGHLAHMKKLAAGLGVVGALTAMSVSPAFAAPDTEMTVGITGTARTVDISALTFEDAALDFSLASQTVTTVGTTGAPAVLTVVDLSGNSGAWTVYAESTNLVSGTDTIANSAITVTPSNLVTDDGATVAAGGSLGGQQVVMSALAGAGDGTHTADLDIEIAVPGSQKAGTYTGTLTVTETVDVP